MLERLNLSPKNRYYQRKYRKVPEDFPKNFPHFRDDKKEEL